MKYNVDLPEYNEEDGIDVFWDPGSKIKVMSSEENVTISANKNAMLSLAKQLLYMAQIDDSNGEHVHYDGFFCGADIDGKELIIECMNDT